MLNTRATMYEGLITDELLSARSLAGRDRFKPFEVFVHSINCAIFFVLSEVERRRRKNGVSIRPKILSYWCFLLSPPAAMTVKVGTSD